MNLQDLPALVEKLQNRAKQDEALESLLTDLGQTLADLLAHQESSGPALAKALAEAVRSIKIDAPPVSLKPHVDVHLKVEPVLQQQARGGWKFHVEPGRHGAMDITCTPT